MTLIVALVLLAASAQATPDRTDFSGRWVPDTAPAANEDATLRLVVDQPLTHTTEDGRAMKPGFRRISIRRETSAGTREETHLPGVIGGTAGGVTKDGVRVGDSSRTATVWRGDALVFEHVSHGPDGPGTGRWTERRETWSLDPEGRLRIEMSTEDWESPRRVEVRLYHRETIRFPAGELPRSR